MLPAALKTLLEPALPPRHLHLLAVVLLPRQAPRRPLRPRLVEARVLARPPPRPLLVLKAADRALLLLQVPLLVTSILGSQTLSPMPLAALLLLL